MNTLKLVGTWFIVFVLVLSGIDKILHWYEFQSALLNYPFLPTQHIRTLAYAVVTVEFLLSATLMKRAWRRYAMAACGVVFIVFGFIIYTQYRLQPGVACGCSFSFGLARADMLHVVQNVALAALCIFLLPASRQKNKDASV